MMMMVRYAHGTCSGQTTKPWREKNDCQTLEFGKSLNKSAKWYIICTNSILDIHSWSLMRLFWTFFHRTKYNCPRADIQIEAESLLQSFPNIFFQFSLTYRCNKNYCTVHTVHLHWKRFCKTSNGVTDVLAVKTRKLWKRFSQPCNLN